MKDNDKEIFFLSILSGTLGSIGFLLSKGINEAKQEQQRALEDARTRFEHEKQSGDERGDV